jgi:putative Mg2+ transporter-C (MgtC) family protein
VQGLTTAATVWVNSAVGVAAGGGQYHLAFSAAGVSLVVLFFVDPLETVIARRVASRAKAREAAKAKASTDA